MITKGETYYFARIIPYISYDVLDIKIRTVEQGWFCGIENRDKQAFLFNNEDLNTIVFEDRIEALRVCKIAEEKFGRKYKDGED